MAPHTAPPAAPARSTSGMSRGGGRSGRASAVTVEARPPMTIWPSPPMFRTFARNAMQIPTPTSSSGIALVAVFTSPSVLPNAPFSRARYAVNGLAPRAHSMNAPTTRAPIAASGMANQLTRNRRQSRGNAPVRRPAIRPPLPGGSGSGEAARVPPPRVGSLLSTHALRHSAQNDQRQACARGPSPASGRWSRWMGAGRPWFGHEVPRSDPSERLRIPGSISGPIASPEPRGRCRSLAMAMREGPWARKAARRRLWLQVVAAFAFLALAGGAVYFVAVVLPMSVRETSAPPSRSPTPTGTTRFTNWEDMGTVAWVTGGELRVLDLPTCRVRTVVPDGASPPVRFSTDGRWIAYGKGSVVPATGGRPVTVPGGARSWAWSPRGERLAVATAAGGVAVYSPRERPAPASPAGGKRAEGTLLLGEPRAILADGAGAGHVVWSPDAARIAVDGPGKVMVVEVASAEPRTVFSTTGPVPQVAGWSADSSWVLFWATPLGQKPGKVAGRALDAAPAGGGPWQNVFSQMLPYGDFVSSCGKSLAVSVGGRRGVSEGKQIVITGPSSWKFRNVTADYLRSWIWPACSPDGEWLAATATANRAEPSDPSGVRSLWVISTVGPKRAKIEPPELGGLEAPRWSGDGRTLLVVLRTEPDWAAPGPLLLVEVDPNTGREVHRASLAVELGTAEGPGGHQLWNLISDWYRPG